jgi:hypothetical protein
LCKLGKPGKSTFVAQSAGRLFGSSARQTFDWTATKTNNGSKRERRNICLSPTIT